MKSRLNKTEDYLRSEPKARERKNRYRAVTNLIIREIPNLVDIPRDKIDEIAFQAVHFNREIRRVQQLNEELRGSDYDENKVELEQTAQIDLEYSPGYQDDINRLKKLI